MNRTLESKCREYQKTADYHLDANKPIIVHIDGRSFSKMVKNKFKKPFDENFINLMNETAKYLCQNVQGVQIGYVQSDEISLIIRKNRPESDIFFSGRLCKLQSILASMATAKFMSLSDDDSLYNFDCKAWNVDNLNDAITWLLYRNIDCVRNSKQMAAQTYFSHKDISAKTTDEQIELLKNKFNIDWHEYPEGQKYGRIIIPQIVKLLKVEKGKAIEFERRKWAIIDGMNLTQSDNRAKLKDMIITND